MESDSGHRHPNYVGLNLVGYGLARFEEQLIKALDFSSKAELFRDLISRGLATTRGTLKNRQDLFNPLVRGGKVGWWQNGDRYLARVTQLDALFGNLDAVAYALMLSRYLAAEFPKAGQPKASLPPLMNSQFRSLQETGAEAEIFFLQNYTSIAAFSSASIQDARQFGDGYDFQLSIDDSYWLAEVKGLRTQTGAIRLTEKEHRRAGEFRDRFCLIVVTGLDKRPALVPLFDPLPRISLTKRVINTEQISYHSAAVAWGDLTV